MLFPETHSSMHIRSQLSPILSLPNIPSFSFCFSPSLGLLRHGATQVSGCFEELHEGWLDWGEVSCDLVHGPLTGTDSVWGGEGMQVLLGVWGSTSKPDAQLCGGEDWQGEGFSLWQQLVLPHPSFHSAHPEDTRGADLFQRTGLPLPGKSLPTRVVIHVHCLSVLRLSLETDTMPVSAVALPVSLVLLP